MKELITFWLRQHLKQGRTVIIYAVLVILAIINSFLYSDRYFEDFQLQQEQQRTYDAFRVRVKDFSPSFLADAGMFRLDLPASPYSFIADNQIHSVPTSRTVNPINAGLLTDKPFARYGSVGSNRTESTGSNIIDLTFLVSVVLSFFAIVITYDSICGMKRDGTLKLILANNIPRYRVFLSKIIAALITISIPFLLAVLVNILLMNLFGVFPFSLENITITALFIGLGLLMILFFIALGASVSSMTHSPITSLVILLLIWTLIVQVIPGAAKLVGKSVTDVRTPVKVSNEFRTLRADEREQMEKQDAAVRPFDAAKLDNFRTERINNRISEMYWRDRNNLTDEIMNELFQQSEFVRGLSRFSPTMVFRLAASRLTNTDLFALRDFYDGTDRYRSMLFDFLRDADARDKDSAHLIYVIFPGYLSSKPIGEELPRFEWAPPDLLSRIGDAMLDILILFSLAMCMLLIGLFVFNRYDVR